VQPLRQILDAGALRGARDLVNGRQRATAEPVASSARGDQQERRRKRKDDAKPSQRFECFVHECSNLDSV